MNEWNERRVSQIVQTSKDVAQRAALELFRMGLLTPEDEEALYPSIRRMQQAKPLAAKEMIRIRRRLPRYWREVVTLIDPAIEAQIKQQEARDQFAGTW